MPRVGESAPDFELESDAGATVRLADLRGKKVILYFYPKDDTPGCTVEACEFRDRTPEVDERGAVILGVSPDDVKSHQKFKSKYDLPFTLLADPEHSVAAAYGAWGEKKRYGRSYEGILRTTFVIDEEGTIEKIFEKVKAKGHASLVLASIE